jgi:hypothetical protein
MFTATPSSIELPAEIIAPLRPLLHFEFCQNRADDSTITLPKLFLTELLQEAPPHRRRTEIKDILDKQSPTRSNQKIPKSNTFLDFDDRYAQGCGRAAFRETQKEPIVK